MRLPPSPLSSKAAAAACGAGLAAALLTIVSARQTSIGLGGGEHGPIVAALAMGAIGGSPGPIFVALVMGFIAPLTIMIASIGFGTLAGGLAALIGALAIGGYDLMPAGHAALQPDKLGPAALHALVFLLTEGLPAWVLGRIAILGAGPIGAGRVDAPKTLAALVRPEERVLGLLLSAAIAFAAFGVVLAFTMEVIASGGFEAGMAMLVGKAEPLVQTVIASNKTLFKDVDAQRFATIFIRGAVPVLAMRVVVSLVVNLWLAARISQTSGLLPVPWPDIPSYLRLPRPLALGLAVALGLSFAGGLLGMLSLIVSAALAMGFALQGLAVVHAVTRGRSARLPLLIIVYLCMVSIPIVPWTFLSLGILGLLDAAFAFRDRQKPIVKKLKS